MFKNLTKPFIIAEMSANHNQSLERALLLVEEAAKSGVDALKIQTYTPDTMTINSDRDEFIIKDENSLWKGETLYSLYKRAYTPWEWNKPIFDRCSELGIIGFSTPFDYTSVDFLEKLDVPFYKIASFENSDLPLLKYIANTGKPVLLSTGMIEFNDLKESVDTLKNNGCPEIVLLKCTSNYPADPSDCNLNTIKDMQFRFNDCLIGLSDHTIGISVALASIGMGVMVIEKHFTISRNDGGVDSSFSIEPGEMKDLVQNVLIAHKSLGNVFYGSSIAEKPSLIFRRSIYSIKDIKVGEIFTKENVKSIRPSKGLLPKHYDKLLTMKASVNISSGTPITEDLFYSDDNN